MHKLSRSFGCRGGVAGNRFWVLSVRGVRLVFSWSWIGVGRVGGVERNFIKRQKKQLGFALKKVSADG